MTAPAPLSPIGYAQAPNYNWWLYEDEPTPELQWPQSISVYDAMRKQDSQVASVLRAVSDPVRRTGWRIDPNGSRDEVVDLVSDDLGLPIVGQAPKPTPRSKGKFSFSEHLRLSLLMLPMGHAFFEQLYRVDNDGLRAHLAKLELRPSKTIERIEVASDGGLVYIKQYWTVTDTEPKPIPVDRLVAYVYDREGGNWLGTSVLRRCYKNWLIKDRLLRVQAQTIERNGMGVPRYTAAETETELATGLGMATSWRAGEAAGASIPFGAHLDLVGVEGTLPDADPAIRYHDEAIARAVLAHFLNLGTQTGSWALGTTFADFFTLSLQTLAQQIADTVTQHVIEDLVDVNFGESEPAPRLVFDEIGSRQAATAAALKTLVDAGVIHPDQVLEESSRQQYGLPAADPATATTPPTAGGGVDPKAPASPEAKDPSVRPGSVAARFEQPALDAPEPVAAKFNPDEPRIPGGSPGGGRWGHGGIGGALKDALKLAERIDLDDDEHLLGSGKVDGGMGGLRWALIDKHGSRSWRFGAGDEGYGQRDRDSGMPAWNGNPSASALDKAERDRLNAEYDDLGVELDNTDNPDREAELERQRDAIRERLTTDEIGFNSTAELDDAAMGELLALRGPLDEALAEYKRRDKALNAIDDMDAEGRTDPAELERLKAIAHWDDMESPVYAIGVIRGSAWGDIHYEVYLDADQSTGVRVLIGVAPKGAPDDYGRAMDWKGLFSAGQWRSFMRQIEQARAAAPKP